MYLDITFELANWKLRQNLATLNVHLKPPSRELCFVRIRKVGMIGIDDIDEVRILSHSHVVLNISENNLDDGITV